MKICHVSSAHESNDVRIYHKECMSLASAGYDVSLIVADGNGSGSKGAVSVYDVGKPAGRLNRMLRVVARVLKRAAEIEADIYHFHDPEILRLAPQYQKRLGKPFIYDVHEDYREGIRDKEWLPSIIRGLVAKLAGLFEDRAVRRLAGVVAATPHIARHFESHPNCAVVQNYPIMDEFSACDLERKTKRGLFVYVGGASRLRGAREMVKAVRLLEAPSRLAVAGDWEDEELLLECRDIAGPERLSVLGHIERESVKDLLGSAIAGLVLYHPAGNHVWSQPNKLFEYMSAGIPVIASNFLLWREIVEGNECGICVDPLKPEEIASAMEQILNNPSEAKKMGQRGRAAIECIYNWELASVQLIDLYKHVMTN